MTCRLDLLSAYYDGELSVEDRRAIAEHVARCVRCAGVLASYRRIAAELRALPFVAVPATLDGAVCTRLDDHAGRQSLPPGIASWLPGLAFVAAVAVLVFAMSALLRGYDRASALAMLAGVPLDQAVEPSADTAVPIAADPAASPAAPVTVSARPEANRDAAPPAQAASTAPSGELSNGADRPIVAVPAPAEGQDAPQPAAVAPPRVAESGGAPAAASATPILQSPVLPATVSEDGQARFSTPAPPGQPTATPGRAVAAVAPAEPPPVSKGKDAAAEPRGANGDVATDPGKRAVSATVAKPAPVGPTAVAVASTVNPAPSPVAVATPPALPPVVDSRRPMPAAQARPSRDVPATNGCASAPVRGFGRLYEMSAGVRQRLGCAVTAERAITITEQAFERGYMFRRLDSEEIYVLASDTERWSRHDDARRHDEPLEAVPATPTGLAAPGRRFAPLWRNLAEGRDLIGWALAGERTFGGMVQEFQHGTLIWSDRRVIYTLYPDGTWRDFPDAYEPQQGP